MNRSFISEEDIEKSLIGEMEFHEIMDMIKCENRCGDADCMNCFYVVACPHIKSMYRRYSSMTGYRLVKSEK